MSDLSSELANFEAELGGDDFDVDAILSSTASSFQAPVAPANVRENCRFEHSVSKFEIHFGILKVVLFSFLDSFSFSQTSSYGPVKTPQVENWFIFDILDLTVTSISVDIVHPQTSASNPSPYARPTTASSAVPIKSSSVSISAPAVITAAPVVISAQPSIASSSSVISASPAVVSAPAYVTAAPAVLTASGVLPPMPPPPHLLAAGAPTYIPPHQIHSQYAVDAAALAAAAAVRAASASASASSPTAGSGAGGDEEEEKKKHLRKAAGKVWEDSTLDAWPESAC